VILKYSRRTNRVLKILESLAIELTGRLGSFLSKQLFITVSTSTITRMAQNQLLPEIKQPRVLGVDDWAYRKGVSYGTILIDMETSKPIDILPSREGKDLKKWLIKMESGAKWELPAASRDILRSLYFYRGVEIKVAGQEVPSYKAIDIQPDLHLGLAGLSAAFGRSTHPVS